MVTIFFVIILLNTNIFAQGESVQSYFFSKGKTTYSSHFSGIIVWTMIMDDKATLLYQTPERLVVVKAELTPSGECNDSTICYDGTITEVNYESSPLKAGDTFKTIIDTTEDTEVVSFLSGFLENADVKIGLQKTRTNLSADSTVQESQTSKSLVVLTEKDQYGIGEIINFTITNNGNTRLFPDGWGYSINGSDGNRYAPNGVLKMMIVALPPGNSINWTWDQMDGNSTQVIPGKYTITASYTEENTQKQISSSKTIEIIE